MPYAIRFDRPLIQLLPQDIQHLVRSLPPGTFLGGSTALNIVLYAFDIITEEMLQASFEGKKFDFFRFMVDANAPGSLPLAAFAEKNVIDNQILGIQTRTAFRQTVFLQSFNDRFNLSWEGFGVEYFQKTSMNDLIDFENNLVLFKDEACFKYTYECQIYLPNLNLLLIDLRDCLEEPNAYRERLAYLNQEITYYLEFASKQRSMKADFSEADLNALRTAFAADEAGERKLYQYLNKLFYDFSYRKIRQNQKLFIMLEIPALNDQFLENMLRLNEPAEAEAEVEIEEKIEEQIEKQEKHIEEAIVSDKNEKQDEKRQFWATVYDPSYANRGELPRIPNIGINNAEPENKKLTTEELDKFWIEKFNRAQEAYAAAKESNARTYEIVYPFSVLKDETAHLPNSESSPVLRKLAFNTVVINKSNEKTKEAKVNSKQDGVSSVQSQSTSSVYCVSGYSRRKNRGEKPENMQAYIQKKQEEMAPIPVVNPRQRTDVESSFKHVAMSHKAWGDPNAWIVHRKHLLYIDPAFDAHLSDESKNLQVRYFKTHYFKHNRLYKSVSEQYGVKFPSSDEASRESTKLIVMGGFLIFMGGHCALYAKEDASPFLVVGTLCVIAATFVKFLNDATVSQYFHEAKVYEYSLNILSNTFNNNIKAESAKRHRPDTDNSEYLKSQLSIVTQMLMVMQELKFRNYDFNNMPGFYPLKLKTFLLKFTEVIDIKLGPFERVKSNFTSTAASNLVCMTIDTMINLITIHGEMLLNYMMNDAVPEISLRFMKEEGHAYFMETCITKLRDTMKRAKERENESSRDGIPLGLGTDAIEFMDLIALAYVHRKAMPAGDNVVTRFQSEHKELAHYLDTNYVVAKQRTLQLNKGAYTVDPFHASKVVSIVVAKGANSDVSAVVLDSLYKLADTTTTRKNVRK